ncbi:MAG: hypothetical protein QW424_04895 [Candidatus Bathyarchaeia archaeon]|nr:hypothetical protein [Candidatus Bathyarchaeota archaeon]
MEEGFPDRKIILKNPENFQLQAAYLAYSEAYDKTDDPEVKKYLNQNMIDLQNNKIDYQTFYRNINKYRQLDDSQCKSKSNIKSLSKSEWRNIMEKMEREKRYKR